MSNTSSARRGRPPGTFSFVTVKGSDILAFLLACPQAEFPISAKYAKEVGLSGRSGPAIKIHSKSVTAEETVAVTTVTAAQP